MQEKFYYKVCITSKQSIPYCPMDLKLYLGCSAVLCGLKCPKHDPTEESSDIDLKFDFHGLYLKSVKAKPLL